MSEKITRQVVSELGVLSRSDSGWTKELNLVSWNGRVPKLDLREWSSGKEKIGKGLTLKKKEAIRLRDILVALDFNSIPDSDGAVQVLVPAVEQPGVATALSSCDLIEDKEVVAV